MGRRRLRGGAPRLLGRHDGASGRAYRRAWVALVREFGEPAPCSLLRLEIGRVAVSWVNLEISTRVLSEARRQRAEGRGRRPSAREIERLSRRQGLADLSYAQALDKLRAMAGDRKPLDLARAIQQAQESSP